MPVQSLKSRISFISKAIRRSSISSSSPTTLLNSKRRPAPLNNPDASDDDLEPLISATLKVDFSPGFKTQTQTQSAQSPKPLLSPSIVAAAAAALKSPSPKDAFKTPKAFKYSSSSDSSDDESIISIEKRRSVSFTVPASPIPSAKTQAQIDNALKFLPAPLSPFPGSTKFNKSAPAPAPAGTTTAETETETKKPKTRKPFRRPANIFIGPIKTTASEVSIGRNSMRARFAPPGLGLGAVPSVLSPVPESPITPPPAINVEYPSSDGEGGNASDTSNVTLNTAFWRSMTLDEGVPCPGLSDDSGNDNDSTGSMKSGSSTSSRFLSVPSSPNPSLILSAAAGVDASVDIDAGLLSPAPYPIFFFGRARSDSTVSEQALYSPATQVAVQSFEHMTSPIPKNDPAASFSSISAALEYLGASGAIRFPINTDV